MREIKFRINAGTEQQPDIRILSLCEIGDLYTEFDNNWCGEIISKAQQYTGLKDKNGKEGYFDSDVWEIKNYEYRVKYCGGYKRRECDLRFILKQGLLKVDFELVNPPLDLDHITLATIFNLKGESGKRMFVDGNRQNLEIVGNIYENPELLK